MDLFLGVDGGQSSTEALIGDPERNIVGRGTAGPCNHVGAALGRARLEEALHRAVGSALEQAGADRGRTRFRAACLGMSGGPDDKEAIIAELIPAEALEVTTDAHIALSGAIGPGAGVIVIAGTGSIALGRDRRGEVRRAGGWGYLLGDEGGAFSIVKRAVRAALRFEEGWGESTALRAALLEETRAANVNELAHWFYRDDWPRERIAALAPLIGRVAAAGDPAAADALRAAARDLALLAHGVASQLDPEPGLRVAPVGGVFNQPVVRKRFEEEVIADSGDCRVIEPEASPARGALIRAYELAT